MDRQKEGPGNEALRSRLEHEVGQCGREVTDLIGLNAVVKRGGVDLLKRVIRDKVK